MDIEFHKKTSQLKHSNDALDSESLLLSASLQSIRKQFGRIFTQSGLDSNEMRHYNRIKMNFITTINYIELSSEYRDQFLVCLQKDLIRLTPLNPNPQFWSIRKQLKSRTKNQDFK